MLLSNVGLHVVPPNLRLMAIAGYLDREAIGFVDCKPDRGNSLLFDND
jgi:hypothetical protein